MEKSRFHIPVPILGFEQSITLNWDVAQNINFVDFRTHNNNISFDRVRLFDKYCNSDDASKAKLK